jgi:hypothetical protein
VLTAWSDHAYAAVMRRLLLILGLCLAGLTPFAAAQSTLPVDEFEPEVGACIALTSGAKIPVWMPGVLRVHFFFQSDLQNPHGGYSEPELRVAYSVRASDMTASECSRLGLNWVHGQDGRWPDVEILEFTPSTGQGLAKAWLPINRLDESGTWGTLMLDATAVNVYWGWHAHDLIHAGTSEPLTYEGMKSLTLVTYEDPVYVEIIQNRMMYADHPCEVRLNVSATDPEDRVFAVHSEVPDLFECPSTVTLPANAYHVTFWVTPRQLGSGRIAVVPPGDAAATYSQIGVVRVRPQGLAWDGDEPFGESSQEPHAPMGEQAIRFLEREIATTRELMAGAERTYVVLERSAVPGLDGETIADIHEYLATLGCAADAVRSLQAKLDLRVRPPSGSIMNVHVSRAPNGGSAILLKDGNELTMWAEWNVEKKYRMDYYPAKDAAASGISEGRIQVNSFEDGGEYDPLAVRVERLRELLDWGLATASRGTCDYTTDAGMESVRVRWSRTDADPLPVRLGLQLAFTTIGQEVEFHLQRAPAPPEGEPVSQLQVVQKDRAGQVLRCEEFQWRGAWPSSFATSKMEYFPGGRLLFKSEHVAIMPEPESYFRAVLATTPSRGGASVMDWRIDGKLAEYSFEGELPPLAELATLIRKSAR